MSSYDAIHQATLGAQSRFASPLWYRGCAKKSYTLSPSLFRREYSPPDDWMQVEKNMMAWFRQRGMPFHDRALSNDWECLFFMQHYRIPTRLLDWSENPYVALYFALRTARDDQLRSGESVIGEDPCVWILEPSTWNARVLQHISFQGRPLSPHDQEIKSLSPNTDPGLFNAEPVALFGTHNSNRIVAQRGVFTIFGKSQEPMERLHERSQFPHDCLKRIVFPATEVSGLLKSLYTFGMSESMVFPDLEGLALEVRRHFGFGE